MTTTQTTVAISPDRVLAGALRLTLVPTKDHRRAVRELRALAQGQTPPLDQALARLRTDRGPTGSRAARMTELLLQDALTMAAAS